MIRKTFDGRLHFTLIIDSITILYSARMITVDFKHSLFATVTKNVFERIDWEWWCAPVIYLLWRSELVVSFVPRYTSMHMKSSRLDNAGKTNYWLVKSDFLPWLGAVACSCNLANWRSELHTWLSSHTRHWYSLSEIFSCISNRASGVRPLYRNIVRPPRHETSPYESSTTLISPCQTFNKGAITAYIYVFAFTQLRYGRDSNPWPPGHEANDLITKRN